MDSLNLIQEMAAKKTQVNGYNLILPVKAGRGGWGGPTSNQACLKLVVRNKSTS